jgi:thiol-disulfide isomerase/thioredoxin
MKRPLLLALLLLAACDVKAPGGNEQPAWSGPRAAQGAPAGRLDRSHAGSIAPDTVFADPDGEEARLADFAGSPLLVNLWATWCGPCVIEMPTLDALAVGEQGRLKVLAVSQDVEGRDKVETFFTERRFAMLEPYTDPQLGLMSALRVDTLPTTILYDSRGREVWRVTGIEDWASPKAAALIAEAESGYPSPAAAR